MKRQAGATDARRRGGVRDLEEAVMSTTPKTDKEKAARAIWLTKNPAELFSDMGICADAMDQIGRRGTAALVRLAALQVKSSVMDESDLGSLCMALLGPIIKKTAAQAEDERPPEPAS
jgi:hypothetical protein